MQLFYSGADKANYDQINPIKSLGGFISSSPVNNGGMNNLFSDLSYIELTERIPQCKAVFLKNVFETEVSEITFFNQNNDPNSIYQIAIVTPSSSQQIERIYSSTSIPVHADFVNFNVVFATCLSTITSAPSGIETISYLGRTFDTTPYIDSIEKLINYMINMVFKNDLVYSLVKIGTNQIQITHKDFGVFTEIVQLISSGQASSDIVEFADGVDNRIQIPGSLKKDESLGIWLKRIVIYRKKTFKELYQDYSDKKAIIDKLTPVPDPYLQEQLVSTDKSIKENLKFTISWS